MQGLILAAGLGRRLGALTEERTKAMIEVGGRALIHRALDALAAAGVSNVVIVTGHAGAGLRAAVGDRHGAAAIRYLENPDYAETNNIYSLWLARDVLLADDTLILESDVVFEPELLQDVLADASPNLAVVARFEPWMDGTVTLLDGDDAIQSLVPKAAFDWREADRYFKTVNIYKFSSEFSRRFYLPFLEAYIQAFGRSRFYEQALGVVTYVSRSELRAHRTERLWYEIDDVEDLRTADTLFAPAGGRLAGYARRHGGYWRFPRLLDACYLVNPFFPTPRLLEELQARFEAVVRAYPSGRDVQSELASRLHSVKPAQVLVGNGASELIGALRVALPGAWLVPVPTFEEYVKPRADSVLLTSSPPEFRLDVAALLPKLRGVAALALVNPNNPTGDWLAPDALRELVRATGASGVRLLLDESFVDFADPSGEASWLDSSLLERHPHVVVLRSLGKSHGVGGLRLGLLGSADAGLLAAVRERLPIWNVNSLAEAFLQIVPRHLDDYRQACRRVAAERERLGEALASLRGLRVAPSQANFLLLRVADGAAPELARALLERHEILVKDCTGKSGFPGSAHLRVAVRAPDENDRIARAFADVLGVAR